MATQIPATQNEDYGFFGTMGRKNKKAWNLAIEAIADATNTELHQARAFLDSRHGRHFADDVLNSDKPKLTEAIQEAIGRWMTWTISSETSRDLGIPRNLPYLQGMVIHYGILAEN